MATEVLFKLVYDKENPSPVTEASVRNTTNTTGPFIIADILPDLERHRYRLELLQ